MVKRLAVQDKVGDVMSRCESYQRTGAETNVLLEDTKQASALICNSIILLAHFFLSMKLANSVQRAWIELLEALSISRISKIKDISDQSSPQTLPNPVRDDDLDFFVGRFL
jgi:hypothetical protein